MENFLYTYINSFLYKNHKEKIQTKIFVDTHQCFHIVEDDDNVLCGILHFFTNVVKLSFADGSCARNLYKKIPSGGDQTHVHSREVVEAEWAWAVDMSRQSDDDGDGWGGRWLAASPGFW